MPNSNQTFAATHNQTFGCKHIQTFAIYSHTHMTKLTEMVINEKRECRLRNAEKMKMLQKRHGQKHGGDQDHDDVSLAIVSMMTLKKPMKWNRERP